MPRLASSFVLLTLCCAPLHGAVLVVDTAADADATDGLCSLREAILAANQDLPRNECPSGAGDDRIRFELTFPETITLVVDLPVVTASLAVEGPGRSQLSILGGSSFAAFRVDGPGTGGAFLRVGDLTIADAFRAGQGGSAFAASAGDRLRIERVTVRDCAGQGYGGAADLVGIDAAPVRAEILGSLFEGNSTSAFGGGAVRVHTGALRVVDSTFAGNLAPAGNGGALELIASDVTIERSTFSGNAAEDFGGAIQFSSGSNSAQSSSLALLDSTFTANRANEGGDALGGSGGLNLTGNTAAPGTLAMRNTIVAVNLDLSSTALEPDLLVGASWTLVTTGWNLIGDPTGADAWFPAGTPNGDVDFVGTSASPLDPRLEALADNGGGTPTHRPLIDAASLVIDHGFCPDAEVDQRGHGGGGGAGRIVGVPGVPDHVQSDGCDIGAVERNTPEASPSAIFADGLESGTTLVWSSELP